MGTSKMQTWSTRDQRWQDVPGTEGSQQDVALRVALEAASFKRGVDTKTGALTVAPKMHGESVTEYLSRIGLQLVPAA